MDDDLAALARCVGDVDAFASDVWGQRPLLRRSAGPFDDLLDVHAMETLLVSSARRPSFRLVRDGTRLAPASYTHTVRMGGTNVADVADVAGIGEQVATGATLVMQGLQRTWLPLARFCRRLERATSHPVQANAYLTPPGATGLARHHDEHDVLVLQVTGTKRWDVEGLGPVALHVGDVLYLPTGTAHTAQAQDEATLHITIGLLVVTYRQVLRRVVDQLVGDLDRPLPLGYAHPGRQADVATGLESALDDMTRRLGALDTKELAGHEVERAERRRAPLWDGHLRSVLAAATLGDGTRLRCRPDNPASLADGEAGRVILRLVDRTLDLPAHTRPALDAILDRDELRVGDLAAVVDLDEESRAVLARRLVHEGLCEVVTE